MRVGLPQLLVVLSHELRGPASVLQGYLRLLQRQRGSDGPDPAILDAMHAATSRLTNIGQDASTLAHWLDSTGGRPAAMRAHAVPDLLSAVAALLPEACSVESPPDPADPSAIATRDEGLLARALAEVARAAARAHDGPMRLRVCTEDATLVILMVPAHTGSVTAPPLAFDSGGVGLGLVLASYVLDGHGASVTTQPTGAVEVRLPLTRSAS
jgi:signal transduction histidine kinase